MTNLALDEVMERLKALPEHLRWRVLEFVRELEETSMNGTRGSELLRFAGSIAPDDLESMQEAIDRDCERIDRNEW
jgi:hypothetical protein